MADGYTVKHVDDFETMDGSGGCTWRLARRGTEAESFGFNVVDIEPGGEMPAHNEAESGQEEVFIVLEGEGTIVAGDDEHPGKPGTFVRYAPETHRTIRNDSDAPVRALVIGVARDSSYSPPDWA